MRVRASCGCLGMDSLVNESEGFTEGIDNLMRDR